MTRERSKNVPREEISPESHPSADDPRQPNLGLREAIRIFFRHASPRVMVGGLATLGVLRLVVGDFSVWDLVLAAGLVSLQPFGEWLIHVYLLHFRPRTIAGRRIDFVAARYHRAHHREPHDPRYWFIPLFSGLVGAVINLAACIVLLPTTGLTLTALWTILALGFTYEWTHFLCHTSYRPRSAFYKRIWRHHRLHHFKNERYWMGVSMHMGDRVFGTMRDPSTVETSPKCRDLLGEDEDR
jgi:sterol desaturase/sphingolipid hydroxylase (fatty acid hydroxylase superfamily)